MEIDRARWIVKDYSERIGSTYAEAVKIVEDYITDLEKHRDVSSCACEMIEKRFIDGKYEEIEEYIRNFLKDTRTVSEIVGGSNE